MPIRADSGRPVVLAVVLLMSLILSASAACPETKLKVLSSGVAIENPGALAPGTAVVMSVRVNFPDKENTTYPETSQLELTSGLDNPAWTWNIVRNGMKKDETEERKSRVIISGDVLSWPANTTEFLDIRLYGIAPPVMETTNLTVMRVLDVPGTTCTGSPVYEYHAHVLNTTVIRERIISLNGELARLRADAAAKNRSGGGTSGILEKIDEAQRNLDTANSTPVFEFVSVGLALDRADAAIADGKQLLREVMVSGTVNPKKEGTPGQDPLPGSPAQTPASAVPAPLLTGIVACGAAVLWWRWGCR